MNGFITAFFQSLQTVLDLFFDHIGNPARAHARLLWRDIDRWLINRGQTWSQFFGQVIRYILVVVCAGFVITLIGLIIGSTGSVTALEVAQWFVIVGMIVGLVGLLPFALMYFLARGLYDVVFQTGTVCIEILKSNEGVSATMRVKLDKLRNMSILPFNPQILFTGYVGAYLLCVMFPQLSSIKYVFIAVGFGYVTFQLREALRIKGWALGHFCYAFGLAFMWFATPAYFLAQWLNKQSAVQHLYPVYKSMDPADARFFAQLIFAALALIISCVPLYLTTYSVTSDTAMDAGDVRRKAFTKKAVGFKEDGSTKYEIVQPSNFSWLKSPFLWAGLAVVFLFVWTQVLGKPNPLAGIASLGLVRLAAYGLIAMVVIAVLILVSGETESETETKEAGRGDH